MAVVERQVFETPTGQRVIVCDKSCETAYIVKYAIVIALFGLVFIWLFVGYWHARKRISNGLPPLAYHRWLAPRRNGPRQNDYVYYRPDPYANGGAGGYGMNGFGNREPLPVYSGDLPPSYQPKPEGKTGRQENGIV